MTTSAAPALPSPYEMIGGDDAVARLVNRFYDLMDSDPSYAQLRAIHAADLARMRESLAGFLTGWLGGPRHWFQENPGVCMMSAHAKIPIDPVLAMQWTGAMARALADTQVETALAQRMNEAFRNMCAGMVNRETATPSAS